jgi:hypothetical protein
MFKGMVEGAPLLAPCSMSSCRWLGFKKSSAETPPSIALLRAHAFVGRGVGSLSSIHSRSTGFRLRGIGVQAERRDTACYLPANWGTPAETHVEGRAKCVRHLRATAVVAPPFYLVSR